METVEKQEAAQENQATRIVELLGSVLEKQGQIQAKGHRTGYDWNEDPEKLTRLEGDVYEEILKAIGHAARLCVEVSRLEEIKGLLDRADAEIKANDHKGLWKDWQPGPEDIASEIHHHADKFLAACDAGDLDEIAEHLADLFNYVRKGWEGVVEARAMEAK